MTNEDREKIITTINKEAEESKTLLEKYEELKKLAHEPIVQKYLYLLNEINRIEMDIEKYRSPVTGQLNDSLANRIHHWFRVGALHVIIKYGFMQALFINIKFLIMK